mmetsp:Transcript_19215/g.34284  ORF Transcript_19215/g.34284 Transcript_19215/m.34284 type:complete len:81 (-) Transcript_19215:92-334(-)
MPFQRPGSKLVNDLYMEELWPVGNPFTKDAVFQHRGGVIHFKLRLQIIHSLCWVCLLGAHEQLDNESTWFDMENTFNVDI